MPRVCAHSRWADGDGVIVRWGGGRRLNPFPPLSLPWQLCTAEHQGPSLLLSRDVPTVLWCPQGTWHSGVLVAVENVQEILSLPFLASLIWWQRQGGMGKKETWGCRPAPGGNDAVENGLGHHYSETLSFSRACSAHPLFPWPDPLLHIQALSTCALWEGRQTSAWTRGWGWVASPPQDSWRYHRLSMGLKRSRGTLEPRGAKDDQTGLCYVAQSNREDRNTGMLAQW